MPTNSPKEPPHVDSHGTANDIEAQTEEVLSRVESGGMTTDAAEGWANARGLPRFTGRPDPSTFDPMSAPSWTPLQAVAWIAYRDVEEVRNVSTEFRQHWFLWHPYTSALAASLRRLMSDLRLEPEGSDQGWHIEKVSQPSFYSFVDPEQRALEGLAAQEEQSSSGDKGSRADQARDELWQALTTGKICATGFIGEAQGRSAIPPIEWTDLTFAFNAPDVVQNLHGLTCTAVSINSQDILKLWPPLTNRLHHLLRQAAERSGGQLKVEDAMKIVRESGLNYKEHEVRTALKKLGVGMGAGRPKKTL
jgi:hypothetical protein